MNPMDFTSFLFFCDTDDIQVKFLTKMTALNNFLQDMHIVLDIVRNTITKSETVLRHKACHAHPPLSCYLGTV